MGGHEPLDYEINTKKTCSVEPGVYIPNSIKEPFGVVGLVPCAIGGDCNKEMAKGTKYYENMVKTAKAAVQYGGKIKVLLWFQGETDMSSKHDANSYKANMEKLIHNMLADLHLPYLPIVQVAIASGDGKSIEKVRASLKGINLTNVVCVDAK